jgi:hypothetical protein
MVTVANVASVGSSTGEEERFCVRNPLCFCVLENRMLKRLSALWDLQLRTMNFGPDFQTLFV